jgi:ElaB/YqjD/DUF883 family membrane-anchored ribosome-binding protein
MPKLSHNAHKVKTQARSRWDKLTEDDFDAIENNVLELATRLQARYGIAAEEAQKQAEQFMNSLNNAATDVYSEGKEVLDNVADRVDRTVKDNAWATVGGALLLGGVIGYLMGIDQRRSRWY